MISRHKNIPLFLICSFFITGAVQLCAGDSDSDESVATVKHEVTSEPEASSLLTYDSHLTEQEAIDSICRVLDTDQPGSMIQSAPFDDILILYIRIGKLSVDNQGSAYRRQGKFSAPLFSIFPQDYAHSLRERLRAHPYMGYLCAKQSRFSFADRIDDIVNGRIAGRITCSALEQLSMYPFPREDQSTQTDPQPNKKEKPSGCC